MTQHAGGSSLHHPQLIPLPRYIRRSIIRRIRGDDVKLNCRISLSKRTLCRSFREIHRSWPDLPSRNILAVDGSFEDLQRDKRLVERDFVTRFVDSRKCEFAGLLDLSVDDVVGGADCGGSRS